MNAIAQNPTTIIEKEEITGLNFPKGDVLSSEIEQSERQARIKRGMRLGNNLKRKVKIIFEDNEGLKKVETTIWGYTDKNVLLKKETTIPIRCIHEVKFY